MRGAVIASAVLIGSLLVAAPGHAIPTCTALATIDGEDFVFTVESEDGKTYYADLATPIVRTGWELTGLSVTLNSDPNISYGVSIKDLETASTFSFSFGVPIVPVIGPNRVSASISYSGTAGGDGSVTVTALSSPVTTSDDDDDDAPEILVASLGEQMLPLTSLGHDLGITKTYGGLADHGSYASPEYYESGSGPASATGWRWLQVDVNFEASGYGDVVTMNGAAAVAPVPVPPSLLLLAPSLLGMAAVRRRFTS